MKKPISQIIQLHMLKAILSLCILIGLMTGFSSALTAKPDPAIQISGFKYTFIDRGQIYMNVCEQKACIPGSKVSYQIMAPESKPDYARFKKVQKKIKAAFKNRLEKGARIKFSKPQREKDALFTIFTNDRELTDTNGSKQFTRSTLIHTDNATISLISSSADEKTMMANLALFKLGLLTKDAISN